MPNGLQPARVDCFAPGKHVGAVPVAVDPADVDAAAPGDLVEDGLDERGLGVVAVDEEDEGEVGLGVFGVGGQSNHRPAEIVVGTTSCLWSYGTPDCSGSSGLSGCRKPPCARRCSGCARRSAGRCWFSSLPWGSPFDGLRVHSCRGTYSYRIICRCK